MAILPVLFFAACNTPQQNVIPAKKLESIVLDMQLADALASNVYPGTGGPGSKEDSARAYYAAIYKKHGITAEDFRQSIISYGKDPAALDTIYAHVLARLTALEKEQGTAVVAPRMAQPPASGPVQRPTPPREAEP